MAIPDRRRRPPAAGEYTSVRSCSESAELLNDDIGDLRGAMTTNHGDARSQRQFLADTHRAHLMEWVAFELTSGLLSRS